MELTTSQAARAYETHPNVLNRLILIGRLIAKKNTNGHWQISKESLEQWDRNRVRRSPRDRIASRLSLFTQLKLSGMDLRELESGNPLATPFTDSQRPAQ